MYKDSSDASPHSYRLINKLAVEFIGDLIFVFVEVQYELANTKTTQFTYDPFTIKPVETSSRYLKWILRPIGFLFPNGITQALADESIVNAALSHGITIFVLAASLGHISGGHFNPAVTLTVILCEKLKLTHGILYITAQLFGGFCGALLARAVSYESNFLAINGGATILSPNYGWYQGLVVEAITTFVLTQSVIMTAVDTSSNMLAPLAIGLSVALGILAVGAISGASMNPARSLGPAFVSWMFGVDSSLLWSYHFIYWIGPLIGALITSLLYRFLWKRGGSRII